MIKKIIMLFLILISILTKNIVGAEPLDPLGCVKYPIMFRGSPTNVERFNVNSGVMEVLKEDITNGALVDAIGYNETDGYFWGYNSAKRDGTIIRMGQDKNNKWGSESFKIAGLEGFAAETGDVNKKGQLYLKGSQTFAQCKRVVVVDVNPNSATYLTKIRDFEISYCLNSSDWAFNPVDDMIYTISDGMMTKLLVQIDPKTGEKLYEKDTGLRGTKFFTAQYFDKNGFYYIYTKQDGNVYRIKPTESPKAVLFSHSDSTLRENDGGGCRDIEFKSDLGDLPDQYHTSLENYGAKHVIPPYSPPTLFLGHSVTEEVDGVPSETANSDDGDDGVYTLNGDIIQDKAINKDTTLIVKTQGAGYLNAWIDWDANGTFEDSEQIAKALYINSGEAKLKLNVPESAKEIATFARFRYSSRANLSSLENAEDGEVEDYRIVVQKEIKKGLFNVERTDSGSYTINSKDRNAWYTQIVGRDFDYSLLFYDELMTKEENLEEITVKIELIDQDTNEVLFTKYDHIGKKPTQVYTKCSRSLENSNQNSSNIGRKNYLDKSDLNSIPATKNAIFRVSYGVKEDGSVIKEPCNTLTTEECFNALPKTETVYARDNFAIRPEYFNIEVSDNNNILIGNRSPYNKGSIRLTAGYDYNLTVTASAFGDKNIPSKNYNTTANRIIEFLDKKNIHVVNNSDINSKDIFKEGISTSKKLEVQEVGRYKLSILDSDWADVDIEKGDCNRDSSTTSFNGNIKCGCNVSSLPDVNLTFYPDHFNVNLKLKNLPQSSHDDFIYMSEINSTYSETALSYSGRITAKSEDDITTKNFIKDYMAEDTTVNLSGDTKSQEGIDKKITTIKGDAVYFTRVLRFNSDSTVQVDKNQIFNRLPEINIPKDKFENDQNGSVYIDLRYNVKKHLSQPVNPIQIKFKSVDVNSSDAYSISHGKDETNPYIPKGKQELGGAIRNLYTSQVAPDKIVCPKIRFEEESIIRTPLQVEIFCGGKIQYKHCVDTNLTKHIRVDSSPRAEIGWFLSYDHNSSIDGVVEEFKIDPRDGKDALKFQTLTNPLFPIRFENGRNGAITTKFINQDVNRLYRVDVYTSEPLKFYSGKPKTNIPAGVPHYTVQGIPKTEENPDGDWIGKGKTGNVLDIDSRGSVSHKMDW